MWKRPLVSEDETPQLLERFYEEGDASAFEPSEDVFRFYDELVAMYTDFEGERSDRIIDLSLSWSVPDDVLNGIVGLAQKRDLVLYDPQGPTFHSPAGLLVEPVRRDPAVLRQALKALFVGVALVVGGWAPDPRARLDRHRHRRVCRLDGALQRPRVASGVAQLPRGDDQTVP